LNQRKNVVEKTPRLSWERLVCQLKQNRDGKARR